MIRSVAIFVTLALVICCVSASDVVVLDDSNFDAIVGNPRATFIKFYAPWCGHCKSLAPAWEALGSKFASHSKRVVIAEVDCDAHSSVCSRFGVSGYPTIKWFPASSYGQADLAEDYRGGRDVEALSEFVSEKVGVASHVLVADDNSFDDVVLKSDKGVFVKFYAPWCGHCKNLAPTWDKLGTVFQNEASVAIAKINADTHRIASAPYNIQGFPTLIWFPAGDKSNPVQYENDHSLENLVAFVNEHAGTQRTPEGTLNADAGRVPALDTLASEFIASADRAGLRAQAAAVKNVDAFSQKVYLAVMDKIASQGTAFVPVETARIQKIISGGSISLNKADEFQKRLNILAAFSE